ncbi:hypothetical protein ACKVMT_06465 [Halobacteriales archaeon Cl-PHB]
MSDEVEPGLSDQYRKASPWPMFVALGVVVSELGVVFGLFPVTVGGLVLFGGTVAGILTEAEYVSGPRSVLLGVGALLVALGGTVVMAGVGVSGLSVETLLDPQNGLAYRAAAIAAAGVILLAVGAVLPLAEAGRT